MWPPLSLMPADIPPPSNVSTPAPTAAPPSDDGPDIKWPSGVQMILYSVLAVDGILLTLYAIYLIRLKIKRGKTVITDQDYVGLPLAFHPSIPIVVRLIVPLVLGGLVALFYSAHTQTGASFDVYINVSYYPI